MKNVLVTGGAGFIGSNFISYWLEKYPHSKVTNLDKLTYSGHLSSTESFVQNKNYKFVQGDITDKKLVFSLMKNIDLVVHFAAESHVDRSILGAEEFVKTNVLGTHVLLEVARKCKVLHFHHVSTDEVFGSLDLDDSQKFEESTAYDPRSPYAASKAGADHLVRAYYHTYKMPVTISNASNNYGPYQDPEKFIPRMITNLLLDGRILIYGDGKNVRDWIHVKDHVKAIDLIIAKAPKGQTYMVGSGQKDTNNLVLAEKIAKIFGKKPEKVIFFVKDRPGHDRRYAVCADKIKSLGWSQTIPDLDKGLETTVSWYRENKWWWEPIKSQAESLYEKTGQK